jgi:hypothetical protein
MRVAGFDFVGFLGLQNCSYQVAASLVLGFVRRQVHRLAHTAEAEWQSAVGGEYHGVGPRGWVAVAPEVFTKRGSLEGSIVRPAHYGGVVYGVDKFLRYGLSGGQVNYGGDVVVEGVTDEQYLEVRALNVLERPAGVDIHGGIGFYVDRTVSALYAHAKVAPLFMRLMTSICTPYSLAIAVSCFAFGSTVV